MAPVITTAQALDIGNAMRAKALGYAAKTSTAIDLVVVSAANAKHEFSLSPIKLLAAMRTNLSQDELDSLPDPGSHWKNKDGTVNNNADICQWKDPSKSGDAKAKEISFYVVWADNTPEGKNVVRELDWISRLSTEGMTTADIPAEYKSKYSNPQMLKKHKKYLEGRRSTVRGQYKTAVRLHVQLEMVNELDGVIAELGDDGDNTVLVMNKYKQRADWKYYSVGAFLKLSPLKASESDGSYAALEATAKRAVEGQQDNKTGIALNSVQTPESSDKIAVVWDNYLDRCFTNKSKNDSYAALIKHLTSDSGRQAVLTMGGIRDKLNELFKMQHIQSVYDIEKQKIEDAA